MNRKSNSPSRTLTIALAGTMASLALLGSSAAHADSEQAVDACIQEFLADHLSGYRGKITVRKESVDAPSRMATDHRVIVDAVHRRSGARLATVTCHVDNDGKIVSMRPTMIATAKLAELAKAEPLARNEAK